MFHRPMVHLNLDHDSAADPLNPTVNYTHFQPSPEQRDPNIPLGFQIYGIGCLVAFVAFLIFVVGYVIYQEIKQRIRSTRHGREDEEILHREKSITMDTCLDSPVYPKTLLAKSVDYAIPVKPSRVIPNGHPCLSVNGPQEPSSLEASDIFHNEEKERARLKYASSLPKGILKTSPTYVARGLFKPADAVSPCEISQEVADKPNNACPPGLGRRPETYIVHLSSGPNKGISSYHQAARRVSISIPTTDSMTDEELQPSGHSC